jgi:hypothetical protein
MKFTFPKKVVVETAISEVQGAVAHVKRELPLATTRHHSDSERSRIANLTDIPRTDHAAFRSWWLGAHSRRCCLEVLSRYGSEGFGLELELCEVAEEVMAAADVHRDAFESTRERLAGRMWSLINSLEPPDGLLSGPELAAAGVEVFDYVPA